MKNKPSPETLAALSEITGIPVEDMDNVTIIRVNPDSGPEEVNLTEAAEEIVGSHQVGSDNVLADPKPVPKNPSENLREAEKYLLDWAKDSGFGGDTPIAVNCLTIAKIARELSKQDAQDDIKEGISALMVHAMLIAQDGGTSLSECFDFAVTELEEVKRGRVEKLKASMELFNETLRHLFEERESGK